MTRYRGSGAGDWRGDWYRYAPSLEDFRIAREYADRIDPVRASDDSGRGGYGPDAESHPEWRSRGFLGEVAALHPLRSGPELETFTGKGWQRRSDFGPLEVRTTTYRALRGGSSRYPSLGGWPVFSKDAGRIIVGVEDRGETLVVMGWLRSRDALRLARPLGGIIAVVYPDELRPLAGLAPYAETLE